MTTTTSYPDLMSSEFGSSRQLLTPDAVQYLKALHSHFNTRRVALLEERRRRQAQYDQGALPGFLPETQKIRDAPWQVAAPPPELLDRRVEITGPPDRKMIINALHSGARVFMADFEDSNSPTWNNCMSGQRNLIDANLRTITFRSNEGRMYELNANPAVMFVRPRGWHLLETRFWGNGSPISAALFDFGLFLFLFCCFLLDRGSAPFFYLPKLESHLEARLWNDVFVFSQRYLGVPIGTIRATVLIETISAAFEMDEILYDLRDHSAGLNCGRWDYIFSFI